METVQTNIMELEDFIKWYHEIAMGYSTTEIGQYYPEIDMEHLINKLAVWYEFKYNYDRMTDKNNSSVEVFTMEQLLKSLPWYERFYLLKTRYVNMVKVKFDKEVANINIDEDGYITYDKKDRYFIKEFKGMHVKDAVTFIKENAIPCSVDSLEKAIDNYGIQEKIKEVMFYSVIKRIIVNDNKNGIRRALMFIKEFNLSPDMIQEYVNNSGDVTLIKELEEYRESRISSDKRLAKVE